MNNSSSSGSGCAMLLFLVFLMLKLANIGVVASWSWLWVTSPMWLPIAAIIVLMIGNFILKFLKKKLNKKYLINR